MTHAERIAKGLSILIAYGAIDVTLDHDVMYVWAAGGKCPSVNALDVPHLEAIGWTLNADLGTWSHW